MPEKIVFMQKVGDYMHWYRRKMRGQAMAATPPPMVTPQKPEKPRSELAAVPILPAFPPPVHLADIKTTLLGVTSDAQARIAYRQRASDTRVLARRTPETDPQQERAAVAVLPGRRARTIYANSAAQPSELVQEGILKFAQQHPGVQVARVCTSDFNIDILRLHDLVPFGPIQVAPWHVCEEFQPHNSVVIIYGPE